MQKVRSYVTRVESSLGSVWPFGSAKVAVHCQSGPAIRPRPGRRFQPQHAGLLCTTRDYVEKVRPRFLSLRQPVKGHFFSGRARWQLSPVSVIISNLSCELPTGRIVLFFSERPVFLRTSGLHPFSTVLEKPLFRVSYGLQRKTG